jgi:hypothetical protein
MEKVTRCLVFTVNLILIVLIALSLFKAGIQFRPPKPNAPAVTPTCGGDCTIPGQCGTPGCPCKVHGVMKPAEEWRSFAENPRYELLGHYEGDTFLWSDFRLAKQLRAISPGSAGPLGMPPKAAPPAGTEVIPAAPEIPQ